MPEVKDAYKILGVREGASRDEIEKRFAILLKKHKAGIKEATPIISHHSSIEEIIEAYNFLMGYAAKQAENQEDGMKSSAVLQKIGLDKRKVSNFIYYYKFHVFIAVVAVIVLVFSLKSCVGRVDPDLNVTFVGEFFYIDTDAFRQVLKSKLGEVKEVAVDGIILTGDMRNQQEYAMQMKAVAVFAAGDVDVFILDRPNFEKYAGMGAFMSLDKLVEDHIIDRDKNRSFILKAEEDRAEHLYGIDAGKSPLFDKGGIVGKEKIVAVNARAKHYENAVRLIRVLLEE